MDVLEIKNLRFRYKNKFIFDDFNINIERGSWVTIAGPNGSGKTTLVKILAGLEKSYSDITIFNKPLKKENLHDIIEKDWNFTRGVALWNYRRF